MNHPNTGTTEQHEEPASDAIDEEHGQHGENKVDCACDHNVEQDAIHAISGAAVDLLRIVKEDVDAAPLLQHGNPYAHKRQAPQAGRPQLPPACPLTAILLEVLPDAAHHGVGILRAAHARKDSLCL